MNNSWIIFRDSSSGNDVRLMWMSSRNLTIDIRTIEDRYEYLMSTMDKLDLIPDDLEIIAL